MWRVAATLLLVASFVLVNGSSAVNGQTSCGFVGGFATLRELVGAQKVGACLEDEHFNIENQNAEQRTSGGLLVWRKVDNFTAFTDGATSWINGPNGLQSRPNSERFSWESDPIAPSRVASSGPPPIAAAAPASPERAASQPTSTPAAAAPTAIPTATKTPAPTKVPTATSVPTKTPNPIEIKITEKPDDADEGNEVKFEVETNAKKGTCTLLITYKDTAQANLGNRDVDDGKCEWKFLVPDGTKTGTAKVQISVTGENGTNTKDEEFSVRKGDVTHSGNVNLSLELKDTPDKVTLGEEFKVSIETDVGGKGTCYMTVTWHKSGGSTSGETKSPSGGKCSWTALVPTTITKSGTATLTVTVQDKSGSTRTATKEFDVDLK